MIDRRWLETRGFSGFLTIDELRATRLAQVASTPGVYAVLRESKEEPVFLAVSTGGRFKNREPNVPRALLEAAWVPQSQVVYLGKAGSSDGGSSLRRRLTQYFDFGAGKPVGHWGGRFLWHLADNAQLLVAWRDTGVTGDPRSVESALLSEFEAATGTLPFANLKR